MTLEDHEREASAADAAALDRLFAAYRAPAVPSALVGRILADFDRAAARWSLARSLRRLANAIWPDAPLWQPACALALSLMIGSAVATFASFDVAQQDDVSGTALALDSLPDVDIGQGI